MNLMTIMYIAIQETLNDPEDMSSTHSKLCMFSQARNSGTQLALLMLLDSTTEPIFGRLYDDSNCETSLG